MFVEINWCIRISTILQTSIFELAYPKVVRNFPMIVTSFVNFHSRSDIWLWTRGISTFSLCCFSPLEFSANLAVFMLGGYRRNECIPHEQVDVENFEKKITFCFCHKRNGRWYYKEKWTGLTTVEREGGYISHSNDLMGSTRCLGVPVICYFINFLCWKFLKVLTIVNFLKRNDFCLKMKHLIERIWMGFTLSDVRKVILNTSKQKIFTENKFSSKMGRVQKSRRKTLFIFDFWYLKIGKNNFINLLEHNLQTCIF